MYKMMLNFCKWKYGLKTNHLYIYYNIECKNNRKLMWIGWNDWKRHWIHSCKIYRFHTTRFTYDMRIWIWMWMILEQDVQNCNKNNDAKKNISIWILMVREIFISHWWNWKALPSLTKITRFHKIHQIWTIKWMLMRWSSGKMS